MPRPPPSPLPHKLSNNILTLFLLLLSSPAFISTTTAHVCTEKRCEYHFDVRWQRTMTYYDNATRTLYNVEPHDGHLMIVSNSVGVGAAAAADSEDVMIGRHVAADDVITADGRKRNVITVNGQFPGPAIEVLEGAEVVVHVQNNLGTESLSVHWHGMHQRGSQWMDGVAYVTQCPVAPGTTFTYTFSASPAGAHWYHSHLLNQRDDGLYGALLVHRAPPSDSTPKTVPLILSDLYRYDAATVRLMSAGVDEMSRHRAHTAGHHHNVLDSQIHNVLINGRGRQDLDDDALPLAVLSVERNRTYRFQTIHAAADFSYKVSIDSHKVKVVAMDGFEIEPVTVDMFYINPGETVEFELTAEEEGDAFWIRVVQSMLHDSPPGHEHVMSEEKEEEAGHHHHHHHHHKEKEYPVVIHPTHLGNHSHDNHDNASDSTHVQGHDNSTAEHTAEHTEEHRHKREAEDHAQHTEANMGGTEDTDTAHHNHDTMEGDTDDDAMNHAMHSMEGRAVLLYGQSTTHPKPIMSSQNCSDENVCTVFNCPGDTLKKGEKCILLNELRGSKTTNQDMWHKLKLDQDADHEYVMNFILSGKPGTTGSSVNGRKFVLPQAPMFETTDGLMLCSEHSNHTRCTNIVELPENAVIDLVLSNLQGEQPIYAHHPVHLHGHSFAVMGVGYPTWHKDRWVEAEGVLCQDSHCDRVLRTHLHISKRHVLEVETQAPVIKDTILVPARGFVVVRMLTDNPGHWFLHCHVDQHLMDGMGILLDVPPHPAPPLEFPRCTGLSVGTVSSLRAAAKRTQKWLLVTVACSTLILGIVIGVAIVYALRLKRGASARL